ncbi:hypothetical protein ACI77O_12430 [Pseudomonas tritici]|uniref:hypothetical protein n=1 Tax=Pseudomonas tritici TaxID=2745518 RepID=UPI00387AFD8C
MSVIVKKAEKIKAAVDTLESGFSFEQFLAAFQALYPKEWEKVQREYAQHERKTKPGKSHPMPEPAQYMRNALNVHLKASKTN